MSLIRHIYYGDDRVGSADCNGNVFVNLGYKVGRVHRNGEVYGYGKVYIGHVDSKGNIFTTDKQVGRVDYLGNVFVGEAQIGKVSNSPTLVAGGAALLLLLDVVGTQQ